MRHGSLFSGIGGFDIAAEWMGWENVFHCEKNKYCQAQLKKLFPNAILHKDIKTTRFVRYRNNIYVLTGGDPCQPHSIAGLGKGKDDDRFLWPEYDRAVFEIQPPWVVNENVSGSVSNGILDIKIDDLERKGYSCQAYYLPAESVGALHQLERIWLVAYNPDFHASYREAGKVQGTGEQQRVQKRNSFQHFSESVDLRINNTDTDTQRFEEQYFSSKPTLLPERLSGYFGFSPYAYGNISGDEIKSGIIRMLDGLPEGLDYSDRNQRISALGNAIVPQVAYEIFKAIEQVENSIQ